MAKQRAHSAFYVRYIYAYVVKNTEKDMKMVYYKRHKGSPWIKSWLNAQKNERP